MYMKKITLKRPKESFNRNCSYEILVGKRKLTELKNGEEKVVEIPNELENGEIKAKIQWCGSEKIELNNFSKNEILKVSGNKFLNKKSMYIIALLPLTGVLMFGYGRENPMIKNVGISLFLVLIAFVLGIMTVWKNKWLILTTE